MTECLSGCYNFPFLHHYDAAFLSNNKTRRVVHITFWGRFSIEYRSYAACLRVQRTNKVSWLTNHKDAAQFIGQLPCLKAFFSLKLFGE